VITLVLYLGKEEEWDGAKTLYELLEIDEELKPFISNHRINLFDYNECKDFSCFQTENRVLFELLSNSGNKEKTGELIRKYMEIVPLKNAIYMSMKNDLAFVLDCG